MVELTDGGELRFDELRQAAVAHDRTSGSATDERRPARSSVGMQGAHRQVREGTNVTELLVDFITSLDGYGAADGWPGWWGLEGPEYLDWLGQQPEADHTILLGATTYRLMSGFATNADTSSEASDEDEATGALTTMPKVVFSSTLEEPLTWDNTRLVRGDAVEAVAEMKRDGAESMRTMGSLSLCRSLLSAGLVDRFRVVVFPVITGQTGLDRIYDDFPDVTLDMVDSRTFDGGIQLLEYVPTVLTGPPGAS